MDENKLRTIVKEVINESIKPIKEDLTGVKEDLTGVKEDLTGVKEDLTEIKETLQSHSAALIEIEATLKGYADSYKENQRNIERLDTRLSNVEEEMKIEVSEDLKVPHFSAK